LSDFEARIGAAEAHCDELLEDGYVLLAAEPCPDGSFNVWTSTGGAMSAGKAEAFLFELAQAIVTNTDACSFCPACQDRKLRVERAIAALDYPHVRPAVTA
jgi:hypothetical protein